MKLRLLCIVFKELHLNYAIILKEQLYLHFFININIWCIARIILPLYFSYTCESKAFNVVIYNYSSN